MKKGINRNTEKNKTRFIDTRDILESLDHKVKFSYKYITSNEKFNFNDCDVSYFLQMINRLQTISNMHIDEFKENTLPSLSNHHIDWDNPKYTEDAFGLKDEKIADEAWQFGLDNNKFGRIHGFIIENRFYIRWFDPKHRLWPLKENENDRGRDKEFIKILKENIKKNGPDWAITNLDYIEENYEIQLKSEKSLNDNLCDELEKMEFEKGLIMSVLCSECMKNVKEIDQEETA